MMFTCDNLPRAVPHSNNADLEEEKDVGHYRSVTEHPLQFCYKYKSTIEQKQCVKDMYDARYSEDTVLILSVLLLFEAILSLKAIFGGDKNNE